MPRTRSMINTPQTCHPNSATASARPSGVGIPGTSACTHSPRAPAMTGLELSQRRSRAGLSIDQLAEALNRHVDEVATWERIEGTLPRALDRDLDWILANGERGRAFEAAR